MDKFKMKLSKKKAKGSSRARNPIIGIRRGSVPTIPTSRQSANPTIIRYSSLPTNESSEVESTENETDTSEVTSSSQSTVKQPITRKKSTEKRSSVTLVRKTSSAIKQTEQELEFMTLITSGNVFEAREFLRHLPHKDQFDVNKTNVDGFSPLHIAVHRQDEEMVKVLLAVPDLTIYDTFFYAIKEGDVGMVKQFIEFEFSKLQSHSKGSSRKFSLRQKNAGEKLLQVLERLQIYKDETFNSEFDDDVTPLMLAAQCGHYDLIKMFFEAGQRISQIDNFDCQTVKCKSQGELKMSYARLHIYQAISNPAYICFMAMEFNTVDPILEAFNLITDLKKIGNVEQEVKDDYEKLIQNLQEFSGEILGMCRDDMEVELLLKQKKGFEGNTREVYPRLILAVKKRETDFVTHHHTQKALYTEWIRGFEPWGKMGPFQRAWEFTWRTLLLPFISLWQFIYSKCWNCGMNCCKTWSSPVSRFIHALGSYVVFLILLILEANGELLGDKFDPNDKSPPRSSKSSVIIEWCILVFAVGHIVSTLKQFCFMPVMFFSQNWNIYEVLNHIFYIIAYAFFIKAWNEAPAKELIIHEKVGEREYWRANHPLLLGECFFSLGLITSFGRIFRVLQLHPRFGPLQIALGKMLKGISRLMMLLLTVILAFSAGMSMLFKGYANWVNVNTEGIAQKQKHAYTTFQGATETLFWGLFGMSGNMESLEIITVHNVHINSTGGKETAENHHEITGICAKVMFAFFHIFATLMLLNNIVGMLTGSAGEVFGNVDKEYKMGRTDVWILYGRDMKVPAPFNTIALLRNSTFLRFFGFCKQGKKWKRGLSKDRCCYIDCVNLESDKKLRTAYSILVKDLLQRYFHAKATISMGEAAKLDQVNKVRETVGELREKFKVIFTGATGITPSRKAWTLMSAAARFKTGVSKKGKLSAQEMLENLQSVPRKPSAI